MDRIKDICNANSQYKVEDTSEEVIDLGKCIPSGKANAFLRKGINEMFYKKYGKTLNL